MTCTCSGGKVLGDRRLSMTHGDREYHVRRARAELDMAHRASSSVAADAHMKLSMLHMEKARHGSGRSDAVTGRYWSGRPVRQHGVRLRGL